MPMPPPSPSTDRRDRHTFHEMGQVVRALEARGPLTPEALRELVGGDFWEAGRFERAVAFAVADGLASRTDEGTLVAV